MDPSMALRPRVRRVLLKARGRSRTLVRSLGDPQRWRRELPPCGTRAGAALAFDAGVFVLLGLLAWSLLMPWSQPLGRGASLMLAGVVAFALLWASISAPDWRRYRKLRRRWLARPGSLPPPRRRRAPRPAAPPPRVRSAYRPTPSMRQALHSRWSWRVGGS